MVAVQTPVVRAAMTGDSSAFAELVQTHTSMVCAICLAIVGDPRRAEEVAQDTFVHAWQSLGKLRNPESFRPWLRQLARNRSNQCLRDTKRRGQTFVNDQRLFEGARAGDLDPFQRVAQREGIARIDEALMELPTDSREVLILYYREGQSVRQVADLLEIPEATVRKRLSRGREKMRGNMERDLGLLLLASAPGALFVSRVSTAVARVGSPASRFAFGGGPVAIGAAIIAVLAAVSLVVLYMPGGGDSSQNDVEVAETPSQGGETSPLGAAPVASPIDPEHLGTVSRHLSLIFAEEKIPSTFIPLYAKPEDLRAQTLVYDRLFFRSAITNELKSRLVSGTEKSEDLFTVNLRDDVLWHDGEPLTATDVCFTVDAWLANPAAPGGDFADALRGCEVEGDAAHIWMSRSMAEPREHLGFFVLPEHVYGDPLIARTHPTRGRPIGTGPYRAVRRPDGVRFTGFANPHRRYQIPQLILLGVPDPAVQMKMLLGGDIDGMISVPPPLRVEVPRSDALVLRSYDRRSVWSIAVNTNREPLTEPRVRLALDRALDRAKLCPSTGGDDPILPDCSLVSGPFIPSSRHYNRSVALPERDLGQARAALNGRAIPVLRVGMRASLDSQAPDLLGQVADQLRDAGFETDGFLVADGDVRREAPKYDLWIDVHTFGLLEEVDRLFHTPDGERGGDNLLAYSNPEVDALLDAHRDATSYAAEGAYHELHRLLAEERPSLFLWKLDTKSAWSLRVRNNTITPGDFFEYIESWMLDESLISTPKPTR